MDRKELVRRSAEVAHAHTTTRLTIREIAEMFNISTRQVWNCIHIAEGKQWVTKSIQLARRRARARARLRRRPPSRIRCRRCIALGRSVCVMANFKRHREASNVSR